MRQKLALLLSSEHGGYQIPKALESFLKIPLSVLKSHRGFDRGALEMALAFSKKLKVPLQFQTYSRLLIDSNRSFDHHHLFSKYSQKLSLPQRQQVFVKYHQSYWEKNRSRIKSLLKKYDFVLHLSVHSFTPELKGIRRKNFIGLLYDPASSGEKNFCLVWKQKLKTEISPQKIRMNFPYLGKSNSLVTSFRKEFGTERYLGIELEMNQALLNKPVYWNFLKSFLPQSLSQAIETFKQAE
ncbi:MAG: N-formylglutamate amidohydrolase [Deltaproteobacteria bacterium]|nr:N-formylglutamate amidohydrolase [Deltaproteobacteria bacterium]